jgi:hypothetical protein
MPTIENRDRRRLMQRLLATGALFTTIPALLGAGRLPAGRSIYEMKGTIRVNGTRANLETKIISGDTVETGANSAITFVVDTDAFRMRANSRVELQPSEDRSVGILRVLSGALLSVYGKGRKRIHTPAATIGIRGTGTYVDVNAERTYFCCCYGEADMQSATNANVRETVSTNYHESPRFISATGGGQIVPAPVFDHGDDELVLLESLVGRLPPFYEPFNDSPGGEGGGSSGGGYG